eukprot:jgi/Galph1/2405/GphlegSOOS_G1052.1
MPQPSGFSFQQASIQRTRDLWFLREQAKVRHAEFRFLRHLEKVLQRNQRMYRWLHEEMLDSSMELRARQLTETNGSIAAETTPHEIINNHRVPVDPIQRGTTSHMDNYVSNQDIETSHLVTDLSESHGSMLENSTSWYPTHHWFGGQLWRQLVDQQRVSSTLQSSFRHQLEAMILSNIEHLNRQRENTNDITQEVAPLMEQNEMNVEGQASEEHPTEVTLETGHQVIYEVERHFIRPREIAKIQTDLNTIKTTLQAFFDLELEIQRAIRQELSAALNCKMKSETKQHCSSTVTSTAAVSKGICVLCVEKTIDCLLYACGHMSTCSSCARQLVVNGQNCPICRAPVRDVVRAYYASEE